ncbi:MAG: DNA repair protein RecO C-terminal domain-containing protein, partial [Candidatus Aminicenantes bacterium]|nr:DNA repair protein RecO C-terminal domain-containing protein [Candidatus Aminicenantes bacterium]
IVSMPENIFYFYLVAEILLKFVPYEHQDKRLYRLLHTILENRAGGAAMDSLLLYFLLWILRIEGMMFSPDICYNCYRENLEKAWLKEDFRGILCGSCRTDERLILNREDLQYIHWTQHHSPGDLSTRQGKIDQAHLIRVFKSKIEYHGEFTLKSSQYLPQFR